MCTRVFFFYFVTFTRLLQPRTSVYLDPPPESVNSREGTRPCQIFQTLSQNSNVVFCLCTSTRRNRTENLRIATQKRGSPTILASPFCELIPEINVLTQFSNNYRFNVAHRSPIAATERGKTKREKKREKKRNRGSRRNARVSEHWQARTRTIPHIRERKIVVLSQIKRKTKKKQKQGKREREKLRESEREREKVRE